MSYRVIHKSIAGRSLIDHIMESKFLDHLPIYQIRKNIKRKGVDLAESTINDWIKSQVELIKPLYEVQRSYTIYTPGKC